jgi:hypothetical protein
MRVLAYLTFNPGADLAAFMAMRRDEAAMVWRFYKDGVLRDASLRADRQGALLAFEVADEAAARALVDSLPAVRAGIFGYELIALAPFESYETLFAEVTP